MILSELDFMTGLPKIKESREDKPFRSLPRKPFGELAEALDAEPDRKRWYPASHEWDQNVLMRVRCIKCGADIKGWRMMLDRAGNRVEILGQPAVAFLPYPNMTQTLFSVRLAKMDQTVVIGALHCRDCVLMATDGLQVVTCCIGGSDAILSHAVRQQTTRMNPDLWATYLYRFSEAEPIGPVSSEEATMHERILGPGELITSAHLTLFTDASARAQVPSGVVVEFHGDKVPTGWKESRPGFIEKL